MAVFPKTNLTLKYVSYAFGYYRARLSTLCGSRNASRINMYAKYKPVANAFVDHGARPAMWWKGKARDCGITIPRYTSIEAMIKAVRNGIILTYRPPAGGPEEPFRLGDFAGYDPDALPPVRSGALADTYYLNGDVGVFSIMPVPQEGWLTAEDLYGDQINALYYGAAICKKDADTAAYITEANPITGIGGGAVDIPLSGYTTGEYEIFQFLCEKPKTSLSTPAIANAFIPIGDHWVQTVTIKSGTLRVFVKAEWSARRVTGKIIVTNESNGSETLSRNNILVRYADNLTTTPFEYGEGSVSIPDFTVERQTTVEKNFEFENVLPDFNKRMGAVTFTSNSKSISVRDLIGAGM